MIVNACSGSCLQGDNSTQIKGQHVEHGFIPFHFMLFVVVVFLPHSPPTNAVCAFVRLHEQDFGSHERFGHGWIRAQRETLRVERLHCWSGKKDLPYTRLLFVRERQIQQLPLCCYRKQTPVYWKFKEMTWRVWFNNTIWTCVVSQPSIFHSQTWHRVYWLTTISVHLHLQVHLMNCLMNVS